MAHAPTSHSSIKPRTGLSDFAMLIAVLFVGVYCAFVYDIVRNSHSIPVHEETIEVDVALLLGGIIALEVVAFSAWRYLEQKRETARRLVAERHVRTLACQDELTGLANRCQFDEALKAATAALPREGAVHALIVMDLNGFKQINDCYGHGIGDQVLVVVGQRLTGAAHDGDLVARIGDNKFAILARHLAGSEAATNIALRVIKTLTGPIVIRSVRHPISTGLGIALIPNDATTSEEALRRADIALCRAKEERRTTARFFEEAMDKRVRERQSFIRELSRAVAQESIHTYFQPSVQLDTGAIVGFEALPRWFHSSLGEIMPSRFIPIAEETGLIDELCDQILRQACRAAVHWPKDVTLSIDILSSQLENKHLPARILAILRETGLAPGRLEVEITESTLVRNLEAAQDILGSLREAGVRVALDNFGSGYSSLYHLRNVRMDRIKIDSGFIHKMLFDQEDAGIVRALLGLAHGLGISVAADGIEDSAQQASLIRNGCELGQGHLYSDPVCAARALSMTQAERLPHRVA